MNNEELAGDFRPLVSVIIANFNRADMLEEALLSVIDQNYRNLDVIIVDDGSFDHSLEVVERFRARDPERIRLFTHEGNLNKGIPQTYQLGISHAKGEIVAFLEHDDYWSPNYLENKVETLLRHPDVGVVFSPYSVVCEGWYGRDMMVRQLLLRSRIKKNEPFDNFCNLLQFNNVATFSCFVTRKELLDRLPPLEAHTPFFDWWVLINNSMHSLFYYDTSSHAFWRMSKQSTIGKLTFPSLKIQVCSFFEQMYRYVEKKNDSLPAANRKCFDKYQKVLPGFLSFYGKPGLKNFVSFLLRSPSWAAASALSLAINFLKFR